MFVHVRIIFGNYLHSFKKVTLFFESTSWRWSRKKRFCLLRKRTTSIIIQMMVLHFFSSLSKTFCIPSSTVWWMWSCGLNSYHLFKQSRWTLEFSWSNKEFNRQKVLKGLQKINNHFPVEKTCNWSNINRWIDFWMYQTWSQNLLTVFQRLGKPFRWQATRNFFLTIFYLHNSKHPLERSFLISISDWSSFD